MAVEIRLPQLTDTMEAGTIVKWLVEEGDPVERGDVLAEVETDKATMDIEAFDSGTLLKRLVEEGEEVPTQSLIAVVGEEGEDISAVLEEESGEDAAEPEETEPEEEPKAPEETTEPEPERTEEKPAETAEPEEPEKPAPAPAEPVSEDKPGTPARSETASTAGGDGRLRASPVARRMAAEHRIDLHALEGSGPEGRVVKRDVQRAIEQGGARLTATSSTLSALAHESPLQAEKRELTTMRSVIARRMTEAKQEVPHFYLEREVDVERVDELRGDFNENQEDVKLSYNDFVMIAAARALCDVPQMNASFQGDSIQFHDRVDLSFAVAVEGGLLTPIVPKAETKSILQIHEESQQLVEKAHAGTLTPDEYQGGTFTISNLGMFGVDNFQAVINPPQAGILAVGAIREKPVVEDGEITVGTRMRVTLSCDHRATDGAQGARYLEAFRERIENPLQLLS